MARITAEAEIAKLRQSGQILVAAMDAVAAAVRPGVTTSQLDQIAAHHIRDRKGVPAFLGFQGYPASLCVSINSEVVHGIPSSKRKLKDGDIVGLDLGVNFQGFFTDHAITVPVGKITPQAERLLDDTRASLAAGLAVIKDGGRVGDISAAIESALKPHGYGIVRQLTGHGLGRTVHEPPSIPNFGSPNTGPKLETGMVLAIEPMVTLGDWQVTTLEDGWTVETIDKTLAAHFEHTVLVTADGYELLTGHGENSRT